ncbi:MAG: hypothetical protein ACHQ50_02815 [Fimbriimonadales bacterium]
MPPRKDPRPWIFLIASAAIVGGGAWLRNQPSHPSGTGGSGMASEFLARKERWGTKTGVGEDAAKIDVTHPQATTVTELTALPRPEGLPERGGPGSERFGSAEHTVYTIDAKLLRYKWEEEDDQDYHIVITDWANPFTTMIVEIPDPEAVDPSSPWRDQIAKARDVFKSAFHPTGRFTRQAAHVRVTGVGFFDFLHGQSGVAGNGIELHPVIKVEIIP